MAVAEQTPQLTERDVRRLGKGALLELLLEHGRYAADLQAQLGEARAQAEEAEALAERLKQRLNEKDVQLETLKERLAAKDEKIAHLKNRLDAKDERIAHLEEAAGRASVSDEHPLQLIGSAIDLLSEAIVAWRPEAWCDRAAGEVLSSEMVSDEFEFSNELLTEPAELPREAVIA